MSNNVPPTNSASRQCFTGVFQTSHNHIISPKKSIRDTVSSTVSSFAKAVFASFFGCFSKQSEEKRCYSLANLGPTLPYPGQSKKFTTKVVDGSWILVGG